MSESIDISEDVILQFGREVLSRLLKDKTTRHNIIWATKDYKELGDGFDEQDEITLSNITGIHSKVIQPRVAKAKTSQSNRTKDKAEVFTPSWICNEQNNLIDERWFGRKNVFNIETEKNWHNSVKKIVFSEKKGKTWKDYVDARRMEISCGEAPYLVSRYDVVTGKMLPVHRRIGLLDRKFRVINENTDNKDEWLKWAVRAVQSVYGYEYQGDNLLLARENILYTFIDNMKYKFDCEPELKQLKEVANIIAWNLWQMDGLTMTIPFGAVKKQRHQMNIFDFIEVEEEYGTFEEELEIIAPYCMIKDWRANESLSYHSLVRGAE
ncbi:MAG: restriction endonuclease subunit M [Lachnospiraceae bacterium]|nr:restriction endonuclease subunit M [Lachnospiraceae bacterium]